MSFITFLLSSPNAPKAKKLNGTYNDVSRWKQFLTSSKGGAWNESKIVQFDPQPSATLLKNLVKYKPKNDKLEYVQFVFSGHGCSKSNQDYIYTENSSNGLLLVSQLQKTIELIAKKGSIIIDACRKNNEKLSFLLNERQQPLMSTSAKNSGLISFHWFYKFYLSKCEDVAVVQSCQPNTISREITYDNHEYYGLFIDSLFYVVGTTTETLNLKQAIDLANERMRMVCNHNKWPVQTALYSSADLDYPFVLK